jgi:hypothetical protein
MEGEGERAHQQARQTGGSCSSLKCVARRQVMKSIGFRKLGYEQNAPLKSIA